MYQISCSKHSKREELLDILMQYLQNLSLTHTHIRHSFHRQKKMTPLKQISWFSALIIFYRYT
ncbi:hypothetical protein I79_004331 [Cricetulus griseus]|uniref:Uncharacterized protein n=1 Tax=Cricetulus griseus TaxID=10029 RepID=G3H2C3_CRIGR|nr:hypothetical protein I79_004331 [Cricetulus griseus]